MAMVKEYQGYWKFRPIFYCSFYFLTRTFHFRCCPHLSRQMFSYLLLSSHCLYRNWRCSLSSWILHQSTQSGSRNWLVAWAMMKRDSSYRCNCVEGQLISYLRSRGLMSPPWLTFLGTDRNTSSPSLKAMCSVKVLAPSWTPTVSQLLLWLYDLLWVPT